MIKMIAAVSTNLAIGKDNKLLWNLPEDLLWFKNCTSGMPIVMGSNTWESLPFKPLPNRRNMVLTRNLDSIFNGAELSSFEEIIELSKQEDVFIIGGGAIYELFLPYASELIITTVFKEIPDADTFFPPFKHLFRLKERHFVGKSKTGLDFTMETYTREISY